MSTSHQASRMAEDRRQNENHDPPADSESQSQSRQPPMPTTIRRHRDKYRLPYTVHFHPSTKEKPTRHLFLTALPFSFLLWRAFHGTAMDRISSVRLAAEEKSHRVIHYVWISKGPLERYTMRKEVESKFLGDGERIVYDQGNSILPATHKVFIHARYWIGKEDPESDLEDDDEKTLCGV
ncbi:hypothetical protein CC2G_002702 [Coprinopsis cinerea AmutBmut pab1-1]|nr:hypothetical protein CC2G_002702 [Coprinopsis cinerea AmutBmut pab1-1]